MAHAVGSTVGEDPSHTVFLNVHVTTDNAGMTPAARLSVQKLVHSTAVELRAKLCLLGSCKVALKRHSSRQGASEIPIVAPEDT